MDEIINAVESIAEDIKQGATSVSLKSAENDFINWNYSKNKNNFHSKFEDYLFGACYVSELYKRRVNCFFNLLQSFESDEIIKSCFKTSKTITCIGCGPGPEIVAYFWYLRYTLDCQNSDIKFIGIDRIKGWEIYIDELREKMDDKTEVEFQKKAVNKALIENMDQGEICLMSYPHWSHLPNIWTKLKNKFEIIIVLDVKTSIFTKSMLRYGYTEKCFCDYGAGQKTFYYYKNTTSL